MRMIEQAAAVVARLRQRLVGGDPPEEIVLAARAAQVELLGKDGPMLAMLDARSAAHVLGDPQRLEQWAELLTVEAEAHRKAGRAEEADAIEQRARDLRQ